MFLRVHRCFAVRPWNRSRMGMRATEQGLWLSRTAVVAYKEGKEANASVSCRVLKGLFCFGHQLHCVVQQNTAKLQKGRSSSRADRRRPCPAHTDDRRRTQPPGAERPVHTAQCTKLFTLCQRRCHVSKTEDIISVISVRTACNVKPCPCRRP